MGNSLTRPNYDETEEMKMTDVRTEAGTIIRDGVEYGCFCDLSDGEAPDGCVIDTHDHWGCIFATFKSGRLRRSQWTCKHWKKIPTHRNSDRGDTE